MPTSIRPCRTCVLGLFMCYRGWITAVPYMPSIQLCRQMLVVHGAGHPSKILQDRYLAKLMVWRSISFANSYTTFKTRFSIKEHIISSPHLLTPGPTGVVGGVSVVFHVVAGWDQCGGWWNILFHTGFSVLFLHNRQGTSEFLVYAFQDAQYGFRRANTDSGGPIRIQEDQYGTVCGF